MQSRARGGDDLRTTTIDALHNHQLSALEPGAHQHQPASPPPSPPDTDGEEGSEEEATPPDVPRACFLDDYDHRIREREAKEASQEFN